MAKKFPKIIVINNELPIKESTTIIYQNDHYQNHLEYYQELLKKKKFLSISEEEILTATRNLLGAKICLEGNIVLIDISKNYSTEKIGFLLLPANVSLAKRKLLEEYLPLYDVIIKVSDLKYDENNCLIGKEKWLFKPNDPNNFPKKFIKLIN